MLGELLSCLSRALHVILGGSADWTTSARAWRDRDTPKWGRIRSLIDAIFFWDRHHCRDGYDAEIARSYRNVRDHEARPASTTASQTRPQ